MKIKHITIESDLYGPVIGGTLHINDNTDVWVEMEDGEQWVASFCTYGNIEWLREKNRRTGENLHGQWLWSSEMLIVEQLDQTTTKRVIQDLVDQNLFRTVFRKLPPDRWVWLFHGAGGRFAGGAFTDLPEAERWIHQHRLSGTLTRYPLNQGVFNWALENNLSNLKPETLAAKEKDPDFIGSFTTASMEHYHYEAGKRG